MEFLDFPAPRTPDQCRGKSLSSQLQFFPSGETIEDMLQSTVEYLKLVTKSDGFVIYQYDDILKELYLCPIRANPERCFQHRYKWHIETGNTIATTVLKRKCPLLIDIHSATDLNYPYLQDIPSLSPRYILSLPLMTFERRCFGVVEFYRLNGVQYKPIELKLCQFLLKNCAEALKQNENAVFYSNYNEFQNNLQVLIENHTFGGSPDGSYYFLHKVVLMARDITRSTNSSFFLKKQGKLVKLVNTSEGFKAKKDSLIVYTIGPMSRSKLCSVFHANIVNHKIQGMIRVCDKIGHTEFSALDKKILETISKMCRVWAVIEYASGYIKKQATLEKTLMRLIRSQLQNANHFGMRLNAQSAVKLTLLETWDYDAYTKVDKKTLAYEVAEMMRRLQADSCFPEQALLDFVVMVDQCHVDTKGACFRSSVMIAQSLYKLLNSSKAIVAGEMAFAMMIAALCFNILIDNTPTAKSALFGRYNNFPYELIRFKVIQILIEETQLFSRYNELKKNELFESIKVFLVDMNLVSFKQNMQKLSAELPGEELDLEIMETDKLLHPLLLKILPGLAYLITHFRLPEFREYFPTFFDELIDQNKSCIEIIFALKWN